MFPRPTWYSPTSPTSSCPNVLMTRVALYLGGPPPPNAMIAQSGKAADFRIAVDGGINMFIDIDGLAWEPDLLIGDLDSAVADALVSGSWLKVEEADQNTTDLEKALRYLAQDSASRAPGLAKLAELDLTLFGAVGGRSDHFLSNLFALGKLPASTGVRLLAPGELMIRVTPERPLSLDTRPGDQVSILPFAPCVVSTLGLKWELESEPLAPDGLVSQSNQATGTGFKVRTHAGQCWVIVNDA